MATLTVIVFIITVPCVVFAAIAATVGMIKLVKKVAEAKEERRMKPINDLLKECEDICEEEFEKLLK